MKTIALFVSFILVFWTCVPAHAEQSGSAERVLAGYFEALGGLENITGIQNISAKYQVESYNYDYALHILMDGRFRIERENQVTVYDGKKYWQSFHGVVDEIPAEESDDYKTTSIQHFFFHDLYDAAGNTVSLKPGNTINKHGKTYDVLSSPVKNEKKREYYFNGDTHLLEKIVEYIDDEEFGKKKNLYIFSDYIDISGIKLFSKTEGICLTTNETISPPVLITDIKINMSMDDQLFSKPEMTAPKASFSNGTLTGQVLGFSDYGSLLTNITKDNLAKLGLTDKETYRIDINGHVTMHTYLENIRTAEGIGRGDYLLVFNRTPALWIVKAYVGMKNDLTVAEGDIVKITRDSSLPVTPEEGE